MNPSSRTYVRAGGPGRNERRFRVRQLAAAGVPPQPDHPDIAATGEQINRARDRRKIVETNRLRSPAVAAAAVPGQNEK